MATNAKPITADALLSMDLDQPCELVQGELVMMTPAGGEHGAIAATLNAMLWHHVRAHGLGRVYAAETGFLLGREPDTVLAPDVAFVRSERLPQSGPSGGFVPLAPDFVAEVASPKQAVDLREKADRWVAHGVPLVWIVWPSTRSVSIHRPDRPRELRHESDPLDGEDVLPGFRCTVNQLFE